MIRALLTLGLLFLGCCLAAQSFTATYGFADVSTSSGTVDPTAVPSVSGLFFGSFIAKGVSPNPSASGRFAFNNWPVGGIHGSDDASSFTGALSPTVYYEVSVAPIPGYTLNLNEISFSVRRSGTGIRNYCVRSSLDGYTNNLSASTGTNAKLSVLPGEEFFWNFDSVSTSVDQKGSQVLLGNAFTALTGTVSFRFFAWNSEVSGGSFSIDNVAFSGMLLQPNIMALSALSKERELNMYPNPVTGSHLTIEWNKELQSAEMIAADGKAWPVGLIGSGPERKIAVSHLPAGVWTLRLVSGKEVLVKKLVLAQH